MAPKHAITGAHTHYRARSTPAPEHTTDGPQRSEYSIADLERADARTTNTTADAFGASIDGHHYTKRPDTAERLEAWASRAKDRTATLGRSQEQPLGQVASIGGHTVNAAMTRIAFEGRSTFVFELEDVPRSSWRVAAEDFTGQGLVRQIEHRVKAIPETIDKVQAQIAAAEHDRSVAEEGRSRPFKHTDELASSRARLAQIDTTLKGQDAPEPESVAGPQSQTQGLDTDLGALRRRAAQRPEIEPHRVQDPAHHPHPAPEGPVRGPRI